MKQLRFRATILTSAILVAFTIGCKKDLYKSIDGKCPEVISTNPVEGQKNVLLNTVVSAVFNEKMDPETFTQESLILSGSSRISGTVNYNASDSTLYFTPTGTLSVNTTYTAVVAAGVKDVMGNALQADYVWAFTTGSLATVSGPTVISTNPANNAGNVPLNQVISALFSEPMQAATISGQSFLLSNGTGTVSGSISYSGLVAFFTPSSLLQSSTNYTATITSAVQNVAGTNMAANHTWIFSTGTTTAAIAPQVITTDPLNNATNVSVNKVISVTFDQQMDPSTISSLSFLVKTGNTPVTGNVSYAGNTAFFTPSSSLSANTVYNATITSTVKNLSGTSMVANYTWMFTTASATVAIDPKVISTDPLNNATNVNVNKVIRATFDQQMDPSTISSLSFLVKTGGISVPGTVSFAGNTASFTPSSNLAANTVYNATITTAVKNTAGTAMVTNYVWMFTTASATVAIAPKVISTDPLNNATNVAGNKVITATFDQQMDPATITSLSFLVKTGATPVAGNVTYAGTTASFTPTSNLSPNTAYSATITTNAKNLAGTSIATNYIWTFNTAATPTIGVDLKTAANFGILASTGISNNAGFSVINDMNVGISPGVKAGITGFPPAVVVNGAIYASDDIAPPGVAAMLTQAKQDLTAAYLYAEAATNPAPATVSGDQGGLTLAPGIYKSTSTLLIQNGDLTLDAQGDPNAFWIFQIASAFTSVGGAGGSVILTNGAQAKNVYWQVGSSATIGNNTAFKGNILALTSITMGSGSTATGRMLVQNGAVTLTNTNIINKP